MNFVLGFLVTLIIIFIVPIIIYGLFTSIFKLKEPEKKVIFLIGVLIQKIGTSIGFCTLYYLGNEAFRTNWLIYSLTWFAMFAITEIGQTFMPNYSKKEALAGIISEMIYFPLSGLALYYLIK